MKKRVYLILVTLHFFVVSLHSQISPIDVAENTLKVNALGEEVFYYGFAAGDQLVFNFQELKGKELKELEIIELPSSSKFMDYKTSKIENRVIKINKTGIYKFRLANSAISGRVCKIKIQRIPVDETTRNFDPSVIWRAIYDTVKRIEQERYLVKREYKPVTINPVISYYINSGSNALFRGGKSRITFPVILPRNTVEWYYDFSASRNRDEIIKNERSMNLASQLTRLIEPTGVLSIAFESLTAPPGADYCDIYLLDGSNKSLFEEKKDFIPYEVGTRKNIMSGVVKINVSRPSEYYYIGMKNPDSGIGVHVAIEVVAIVMEEEWAYKDVEKYEVTKSEQAFLNN